MFNVVLLAAGYATRLYPLTESFPKSLLAVADRPIIDHLLSALEPLASEIAEITCVTNDKYTEAFLKWKDISQFPRPIRILNDGTRSNETRLGATRDLRLAIGSFHEAHDVMVFASDNIFDFALKNFYERAKSRPRGVTLACYDVVDRELAKQYGILEVAGDSRVIHFYEKPKDPHSTLASTGIYYFPQDTLRLFDEFLLQVNANADAPGHYISWLVGHTQVFGECLKGVWYDIGDLASLKNADKIFKELRSKKGEKKA